MNQPSCALLIVEDDEKLQKPFEIDKVVEAISGAGGSQPVPPAA